MCGRGPPVCGRKGVATASIYYGFSVLGLLIASLGPALLGLQRQTGASAETLSFIFTLRSAGYLAGSATSGAFLDHFPTRGTCAVATCMFLTALCTALIPYGTSVVALGALCSTQGLAMGVLDTVGNVLIIFLHGEGAGPYMQGLHFLFGVGAMVSPLCVRAAMELSASGVDASAAFWVFAAFTGLGATWISMVPSPPPRKTGADAAAVSTAATAATAATTASAAVGPRDEGATSASIEDELAKRGGAVAVLSGDGVATGEAGAEAPARRRCCSGCVTVDRGIILTTGALLGLYVGAETGFGGFVLLYAQNQFGLDEATGQYLNAVFWACISLGRLLAIPLSLKMSVSKQLWMDVAASVAGCAVLVGALGAGNTGALWFGTALYGLGMASVFPCAVMQAEAFVDLSGRAASVLMIGSATGEMLIPLALGVWTAGWAPGFVVGICLTTLGFSALAGCLHAQGKRSVKHNAAIDRDAALQRGGGEELERIHVAVPAPVGAVPVTDGTVVGLIGGVSSSASETESEGLGPDDIAIGDDSSDDDNSGSSSGDDDDDLGGAGRQSAFRVRPGGHADARAF